MKFSVHMFGSGNHKTLCGQEDPSKFSSDPRKVTCKNCIKRISLSHKDTGSRCKYCGGDLPLNVTYPGQMHVVCKIRYDKASRELSGEAVRA